MGNDETGISQIQKSLWAGNDRGSAPGCNGRVRHGEGCGYGGGSGFGEQGGRRDLCVGRRSGGNGGDPIGADFQRECRDRTGRERCGENRLIICVFFQHRKDDGFCRVFRKDRCGVFRKQQFRRLLRRGNLRTGHADASGQFFRRETVFGEDLYPVSGVRQHSEPYGRPDGGEGILFEFETTPLYSGVYIEGIANLYEFDCGPLSGWMYAVNGAFPNYGCGTCKVKSGDRIQWIYTCDLGRDIGGDDSAGQMGR